LGGCVRLILLPSNGLLPKETKQYLLMCFGCPIVDLFLQPETGICTSSTFNSKDYEINAGFPVGKIEIKLVNIPELKNSETGTIHTNRGEILVKSPSLFEGYFKDKSLTYGSIYFIKTLKGKRELEMGGIVLVKLDNGMIVVDLFQYMALKIIYWNLYLEFL